MDPEQYIGIDLQWDYDKQELITSMDGYVLNALRELGHLMPKQMYLGPSKYNTPKFGQRVQYSHVDKTPQLEPHVIKFIQKVTGKFLFYARAVDNTMLHALNNIASATVNGTKATLAATNYFLNYAACHPNARNCHCASDMILQVHSDAAYLVAANSRSRMAGYHFLGDKQRKMFNGPILVLAKIICNVMASASEAKIGGLFMNAQQAIPVCNYLINMGFPQPPTPLTTDNNTARGIIRGTMKQKMSNAMDMRFNWLKNRVNEQQQFEIFWDKGIHQLADYPTKHHPGPHHQRVRPIYLYEPDKSPTTMQGCVRILEGAHQSSKVKHAPNPLS